MAGKEMLVAVRCNQALVQFWSSHHLATNMFDDMGYGDDSAIIVRYGGDFLGGIHALPFCSVSLVC